MRRVSLAATLLALFLTASMATAADEPSGVTVSLFNGSNLHGWHVMGDPQVEVDNGLLVLEGGNGFVRTDHRYRDFILEIDWRSRKATDYDSGIFFRCVLPEGEQSWPKRYQVNLRQGMEGMVGGLDDAVASDVIRSGEWNHFRLVVRGDTASLEVNGKPTWKASGLEQREGYIGLQSEVPLGGQFEFANIQITELGYESLSDTESFRGWRIVDRDGSSAKDRSCWKIDHATLMCTGDPGVVWLRSEKEYDDFNLRLEYQLEPGGNSGVYLRVPEQGTHRDAGGGVEVQLMDDAAQRDPPLKDYQHAASIYAIAPATEHVGHEAGQWNNIEIDCRGTHYRIIHNGVTVVDATPEQFPDLAERRTAGYIGLQNHRSLVRFQNVRIGPPME